MELASKKCPNSKKIDMFKMENDFRSPFISNKFAQKEAVSETVVNF